MLTLGRKEGQWTEVVIPTGDVLRVRVRNIRGGSPNALDLDFDGKRDVFTVNRPESNRRKPGE